MSKAAINSGELAKTLAGQDAFWEHWGFEPWSNGILTGVTRRQRFIKDGFLGPIAEYGAWDYIIWDCGSEEDRTYLWKNLKSQPEVMTQRFLFVLPKPWRERRIRSFWLGFRGYIEYYAYWPDSPPNKELPTDLTGLVDLALRGPASS